MTKKPSGLAAFTRKTTPDTLPLEADGIEATSSAVPTPRKKRGGARSSLSQSRFGGRIGNGYASSQTRKERLFRLWPKPGFLPCWRSMVCPQSIRIHVNTYMRNDALT